MEENDMKKKITLALTLALVTIFTSCSNPKIEFRKNCLNGNTEKIYAFLDKFAQENNFDNKNQEEKNEILKEYFTLENKESETYDKILRKHFSKNKIKKDINNICIDPLSAVVISNNLDLIKYMIDYGFLDTIGGLITSCILNNQEIALYLIETSESLHSAALSAILENDNVTLFKKCTEYFDMTNARITADNPLIYASRTNAINCVKYMVENDIYKINEYNYYYETPLSVANNKELITYLKEKNGQTISNSIQTEVKKLKDITKKLLYNSENPPSEYEALQLIEEYKYTIKEATQTIKRTKDITSLELDLILEGLSESYDAFQELGKLAYYY